MSVVDKHRSHLANKLADGDLVLYFIKYHLNNVLYRGSYMSNRVFLNLVNELGKEIKSEA